MPFGIPNAYESLRIAPLPHVRVTLKYISMYFLNVCRLIFLFSLLRAVWQKTNRKIAGVHPNPFSLCILILCLLSFLFSLPSLCRLAFQTSLSTSHLRPTCEWPWNIFLCISLNCVPASLFIFFKTCRLAKNKIAKSQETIQIHFLCIFLFCACYPFYFLYFVPFGIPNESLHIASPPHVRVTLKYISMYFLIVCRLIFLFSLLRAVWQKTNRKIAGDDPNPFSLYFLNPLRFVFCQTARSKENKKTSRHTIRKYIEMKYISFPYCVPASLFIFLLRAVWQKQISKSQETIQINFLCISSFCAG